MDETKTTETGKKGKKPAKEKKVREKKPKKEKPAKQPKPKKEKAPKPKKEKAPKEKKPKKEKPPKEKKAKKAAPEDGEEGEEKKGGLFANKKLLIILLAGLVLLIGVAAFLVFQVFHLFPSPFSGEPEETEAPEESAEPGETGEPGDIELIFPADRTPVPETPEETEAQGEEPEETAEPGEPGEPGEEPEATPAPAPASNLPPEFQLRLTNAQVLDFVRTLSPALLGLEGEDMSGYEMFASDNIIPVDGINCTQVRVYSKNPAAGTNDIEGIYLVSRGTQRRLYRFDEATGTVTEIPLR